MSEIVIDKIYLSADTTINEYNPTWNYGLNNYYELGWAGFGASSEQQRGLITADLSYYLSLNNILVTGFKYHFMAGSTASYPMLTYIHKLLKPFNEGLQTGGVPGGGENASTWNHQNYNGTVLWYLPGLDPGVDYAPFPTLGEIYIQNGAAAWYEFDMIDAYNNIDPNAQYGWLMTSVVSLSEWISISSRQNASNNPYFEITYIVYGPDTGVQKVTAEPLNARNSHHIRLYRENNAGTLIDEVGLVLCDANAEENFKSMDLIHTPQESLKTSSGATEHSDFEPPYSSLELDDWSMGRGYSDNHKQKNGYLDAQTMFTVKENVLFSCGDAEPAVFDEGILYSKVDYRLAKTAYDDPVVLGGSLTINLDPPPQTYGSMFVSDAAYSGLTQFHMRLNTGNRVLGFNMLDLKLEIWEAIVDVQDFAPPWTGPPWANCWKPDDANLIATMTMPLIHSADVEINEDILVMWTTLTPFDLDNGQKYFVTLTPTIESGVSTNSWNIPTYNGNLLEYAPMIYRAGDDYLWKQVEDTCGYRKCWKFYIDSPGILFDHRDGAGSYGTNAFFGGEYQFGYGSQFKPLNDITNIRKLVIAMTWGTCPDLDDLQIMTATIYEGKVDPIHGAPCRVPDLTKEIATLTYTNPTEEPDGVVEMEFYKDGGGVFDLTADVEYFMTIMGTPQAGSEGDRDDWTLTAYHNNPNMTSANLVVWTNATDGWQVNLWFDCADDPMMHKFYLASDLATFNYELDEGYDDELITFDQYINIYYYYWDWRYGIGTIFKSKADYLNCIDFHMPMLPRILDNDAPMPSMLIRIWEVTTDAGGCKVPDVANPISEEMTMSADSLEGLQTGVYKEIVWEVPLDGSQVPIDFDLTEGVDYFITLLPDEDTLEYREPNRWIVDWYKSNMTDPAPMVWKKHTTDDWLQYNSNTCLLSRAMWKFYITGEHQDFKAHFAEINRCLHVGLEFLDGTAGVIYRNGELGLGQFQEYTPSLDPDVPHGKFKPKVPLPHSYLDQDPPQIPIVKIMEGPGAHTMRDWSRMVDEHLIFDDPDWVVDYFGMTHQFNMKNENYAAYSMFVLQNTLEFTKITVSPAISQPISDVLGAMGALYISFGESLNTHRLRYKFDYATGVTTQEWTDEQYWGDSMAHQTRAGNNRIWRIRRLLSQIIPANAVNLMDQSIDYALDFDNETEIFVGNTEYRVNSWAIYGDDPHLWILKEDLPYEIVDEDVYEFRNSQMSSMVDARNGRAAIQHDAYLYFSFHDGIQRWHYNGDLLNHGPDIMGPAGLPRDRQGSFAAFAGYGDMLIGAYDAGEEGYSSILAWNSLGWTELYRAHSKGDRILNCYIQSMDGTPVDWLWFSMGSTIMRMPIDTNPLYLINDDYFHYKFTERSHLDSSWISLGLKDVRKYINKFKIIATKAPSLYDIPWYAQEQPPVIEPEYDEDGELLEGIAFAWRTDVSDGFTYHEVDGKKIHQIGEFDINALVEAEAQLIQYRVEIRQAQQRYPIVITDIVMDSIVRLPHKAQIRIQFRLRDQDLDRLDHPDPYPTVKEKYDILDEYANQAAPVWAQIDAKFVGERKFFIDQGSLQVIDKLRDHNIETWVMSLVLKEA